MTERSRASRQSACSARRTSTARIDDMRRCRRQSGPLRRLDHQRAGHARRHCGGVDFCDLRLTELVRAVADATPARDACLRGGLLSKLAIIGFRGRFCWQKLRHGGSHLFAGQQLFLFFEILL
jgi:hypothetical protein